jgi:hypothetical protein
MEYLGHQALCGQSLRTVCPLIGGEFPFLTEVSSVYKRLTSKIVVGLYQTHDLVNHMLLSNQYLYCLVGKRDIDCTVDPKCVAVAMHTYSHFVQTKMLNSVWFVRRL